MIVSLAWLRRYVDITVDAATLARDLTMHGIKVERMTASGVTERLVVVGDVIAVRPHPDAERLRVCTVDVGDGEPLEIVCGAPNVAPGQRVPVAKIGAKLPNDLKIRKSKIRGVTSNGMICSAVELGLGTESNGILVLAPDAPVGKALADVLGESDALLELEVTPNRPDQLGHVGVAREIAALYGTTLRRPGAEYAIDAPNTAGVTVAIAESADCFRFTARVLRGVSVGPSPAWLVDALARAGVHSVNNVVDVTNYVMLELGQPLHAYDLATLPGPDLGVRRARRGESLEALDAKTYELDETHLVITAHDETVGIAGVIGGMPTRITESTRDILIECAAFDPRAVRRARKALNVSTDASYRFERGSDRDVCRLASDRACEIVREIAGGDVGEWVDVYPAPWPARTVTVRRATVKRLLGESIPTETIGDLLERLEFRRVQSERESVTVAIPSFRWDIAEEADLVEEVARMHGYDNIGKAWHYRCSVPSEPDALDRFCDRVSDHLVARGHTELVTTSFTDGRELAWFNWADEDPRSALVPVRNPLSANQAFLRTSLLPGVLDVVARNIAHGQRELNLFSVGRVFLRGAGVSGLPDEPLHLTLVRTRPAGVAFWRDGGEAADIFHLKAEVESLLATHRPLALASLAYDFEATRGTFRWSDRRRVVVEGGIVTPAAAAALDLEQPLWHATIDLTALFELRAENAVYHAYPEFPPSRRDLSLVAPAGVEWGQIEKLVVKAGGRLLESLHVFDVYRGEKLGDGHTAYGARLTFRSAEGTLKDADVEAVIARIIAKLESDLAVNLRS